MDQRDALDRLPEAYAKALKLQAAGADAASLAEAIGVAPEAVPALLKLAHAKRAVLVQADEGGRT